MSYVNRASSFFMAAGESVFLRTEPIVNLTQSNMDKAKQAPDHLAGVTITCDPDQVAYFRQHKNWFEALSWVGQLEVNGQTEFYLWYSGVRSADGMLINDHENPLAVWAQPVNSNSRILLFDERIHGYNAMLIEEVSSPATVPVQKYDEGSFKVSIWTNSSIDFEDEYEVNDEGKVLCLDNTTRSIDDLERNAFDYIGILIERRKEEIRLIDIELA